MFTILCLATLPGLFSYGTGALSEMHMAVVHVALEKNFVGSFPATGDDPIVEARRAAVARGWIAPEHATFARCLVRDGRARYNIERAGLGWRVTVAGPATHTAMGEFPVESQAHDWVLQHLGFGALCAA